MRARETTTKFCMMIKLDKRKFFQGRPRPPLLTLISGDTNADARSVCGS